MVMKILLVDCDDAIPQYLEELFQNENTEVTTVLAQHETCTTAIVEMARTQQFDAAFINLLMPGLNGVGLSGKIKTVSPRTQVVLMSTPCPPAIRAQLRSQGVVSEFFIEPAVLQELRDTLGTSLGDTKMTD